MESSYCGALDRGRIILSPREADEVREDFSDRLVYGGGGFILLLLFINELGLGNGKNTCRIGLSMIDFTVQNTSFTILSPCEVFDKNNIILQ